MKSLQNSLSGNSSFIPVKGKVYYNRFDIDERQLVEERYANLKKDHALRMAKEAMEEVENKEMDRILKSFALLLTFLLFAGLLLVLSMFVSC